MQPTRLYFIYNGIRIVLTHPLHGSYLKFFCGVIFRIGDGVEGGGRSGNSIKK